MCKVQMLRALVNQRLISAVEEIFVVLERTIAEYEEELSRTKEENERQRQLLDAVFKKHQVVLHRADVSEEHLHPDQQEWSFRMDQEEPQPPHVKAEDQETQPPHLKEQKDDHSISQEGEHLEGPEEFPVIGVIVKSEDDEDKGENVEKREVEPPSSSSTQHMTTEADGDHCGGSQAYNLLAPLSDSDDTSHSPDTDDEDPKADMTCHTDNTHFKCSHCGKHFGKKINLKRHTRLHAGERPFTCSVCGLRFVRNPDMKRHMRTHTGDKPFTCSLCGVRLSQKSNLTSHMRMHTGEKPFTCSFCGLRFAYKSCLTKHTRIHTGEKLYSCSVCNKRFTVSSVLDQHMRIHTGEKPFTCSFCGVSFVRNSDMKRHMRIHTGEKVLSFSVCDERFSYKYQLNNHKCAGENSMSEVTAEISQAVDVSIYVAKL